MGRMGHFSGGGGFDRGEHFNSAQSIQNRVHDQIDRIQESVGQAQENAQRMHDNIQQNIRTRFENFPPVDSTVTNHVSINQEQILPHMRFDEKMNLHVRPSRHQRRNSDRSTSEAPSQNYDVSSYQPEITTQKNRYAPQQSSRSTDYYPQSALEGGDYAPERYSQSTAPQQQTGMEWIFERPLESKLAVGRPESPNTVQIERSPDSLYSTKFEGAPTISPQEINKILEDHNSPVAGQGQEIFDRCVAAGIDPAPCMAFFAKESTFGTDGLAVRTNSWGNIRKTDGSGDFVSYPSFMDGLDHWLDLIKNTYLKPESEGGFGVSTVEEAIPIYAPSFENDTQKYIDDVTSWMATWRQEDKQLFGKLDYERTAYDGGSGEAAKVAESAVDATGRRMWEGAPDLDAIQYGVLGCAASVSQALIDAGVFEQWEYNMSVYGVEKILTTPVGEMESNMWGEGKGWVRVDGPVPGAVVCGYRTERPGGGGGAHIGIVGPDGQTIYNNHSDTGLWTADPLSSFSSSEYPYEVAYYVAPDA